MARSKSARDKARERWPRRIHYSEIDISMSKQDQDIFNAFGGRDVLDRYVTTVTHHLIAGDLQIEQIHMYGGTWTDNSARIFYRVPYVLKKWLDKISEQIETPSLVRFCIRYSMVLQRRINMENEYKARGGQGEPEFFSDDFLFLWNKHRDAVEDSEPARFLRALTSLERRYIDQEKRVRDLEILFHEYAIPGILNASEAPRRLELMHMAREELCTVAKRWEINYSHAQATTDIRRLILAAFGYSTTP